MKAHIVFIWAVLYQPHRALTKRQFAFFLEQALSLPRQPLTSAPSYFFCTYTPSFKYDLEIIVTAGTNLVLVKI